ncbi:MAG: adenylate/guanylate cyclase domain-containing protein [Candidatus Thorarchaeota archaeon]
MSEYVKYKYASLEDFLNSNPLNVDGILDDGWGGLFPVKGIELEATILFSDISNFSNRTLDLNPIETLIFVNTFFSWITAESLKNRPGTGIVDKYIGDEIMIIFSKEFGSENHFLDALKTARWMSEHDEHSFRPHIGIASGIIVIGYVGTPLKYNCSIFGKPVAIASRCASIKPKGSGSSSVIFPAELWKNFSLDEIFEPITYTGSNGKLIKKPHEWHILPKRIEKIKNMPDLEIIEICRMAKFIPQETPEDRARSSFKLLKKLGFYRKYNRDYL